MGVVGLYLRMRLEETPAFAAEVEKAEAARPKVPLREMITGQWRALLLCVGLVLVSTSPTTCCCCRTCRAI